MAALQPFSPHYTSGQTVSASNTAASVSIPAGNLNILVSNLSTEVAYVRISDVAVTATAADMVIPANQSRMLTKRDVDVVLSHLSTVTGTTLHIIAGEGWL